MKGKNDVSKYNWMKGPLGATVLTIIGFLGTMLVVSLLIGMPLTMLVQGKGDFYEAISYLITGFGFTIASILVVRFLRNRANQPHAGLQLHLKWTAVLKIAAGVILAFLVIFIIDVLSVTLGSAEWKSWNDTISMATYENALIISFVGILLGQAFPEELFFRGHYFDTLSYKFSYKMVLLLTSVVFGVLHVFSQSPAEGLGERTMYALFAISFGFVLAACRMVGKSLWFPIGFHTGQDFLADMFITFENGSFVIHFSIMIIIFIITGFTLLTTNRLFDKSLKF